MEDITIQNSIIQTINQIEDIELSPSSAISYILFIPSNYTAYESFLEKLVSIYQKDISIENTHFKIVERYFLFEEDINCLILNYKKISDIKDIDYQEDLSVYEKYIVPWRQQKQKKCI